MTFTQTKYACYISLVAQATVNNLAPLFFLIFQNAFDISIEKLGRLILLNFSVQICMDFVSLRMIDKIGYRVSAVTACILCGTGLCLMGLLPGIMPDPYTGICISIVIAAAGSGIIEVMSSPIVDSLPGKEKHAAMSMLHSFYCWGQVFVVLGTTVALRFTGGSDYRIIPLFWGMIPFLNAILFAFVPLNHPVPVHERDSITGLLSSKTLLAALVVMVCSGAAEISMVQWSSYFAEKALSLDKTYGDIFGPCMFGVLMGTGRMLFGIFGERIDVRRTLLMSGMLCVASYLVVVLSPNPYVSLAGVAVCGLSVAVMWPGTTSMTARRFPRGATALFGLLAISGDIGCAVGPWLTGFVADLAHKAEWVVRLSAVTGSRADDIALRAGILAAVVFPAVQVVFMLRTKRSDERND